MRARVWTAYASNNSGSYTIVGRLPSAEVAQEVADELRVVITAHAAWRDRTDPAAGPAESPLATFCRERGLTWSAGEGEGDDWPQYSDTPPQVVRSGRQVIIHHDYTVSLTPVFGELFYKRGGRVDHEEDHAHHPLVVTATFYWGWTPEAQARQQAELPRLLDALTSDAGPLVRLNRLGCPAAWRAGSDKFAEAPLTVSVIFDQLVEGVTALRELAQAHGATMELRLAEAAGVDDPLAAMRPSTPVVPRFDVVIVDTGDNRPRLVAALAGLTDESESMARERLLAPVPVVATRGAFERTARACLAALEAAGARVDLRRNDG